MKTIWIDADATPRPVKDILVKAAQKRRVPLHFVANQPLYGLSGPTVRTTRVESGADRADDFIVEQCAAGDLVISADVPLAARAVEKGATILQPRGRVLDEENVQEQLSLRDLSESLRSGGVETGGPPPFDQKVKQRFADALDRWLTMNGY